MPLQDGSVVIENAKLLFRNFAGREGMYNAEGDRNFSIVLDQEMADELQGLGWNIKMRTSEYSEDPQYLLHVSLKYRGRSGKVMRPPTLVMITSQGRSFLSEEECEILDWVDIQNVDLIIRPFEWAVNGKSGIKAQLKSIYVTINEDPLQLKYQDLPKVDSEEG